MLIMDHDSAAGSLTMKLATTKRYRCYQIINESGLDDIATKIGLLPLNILPRCGTTL